MVDDTPLSWYAKILMEEEEKIRKRGTRKSQANGFFKREWTANDIALEKAKVDSLFDEFLGTCRLCGTSSRDHIANVIYRNHWRGAIPDEVWEYMKNKVDSTRAWIEEDLEWWRTAYDVRIQICGPGDSAVYTYWRRRWDIPRQASASRISKYTADHEVYSPEDITHDKLREYYYGGHRYFINGGCYSKSYRKEERSDA